MNFRLSPSDKKLEETRFKTNICRNIMEKGYCSYGDKCQFAHGTDVSFINTFPVVKYEFQEMRRVERLTINHIRREQAGIYVCQANNSVGQSQPRQIELAVQCE